MFLSIRLIQTKYIGREQKCTILLILPSFRLIQKCVVNVLGVKLKLS